MSKSLLCRTPSRRLRGASAIALVAFVAAGCAQTGGLPDLGLGLAGGGDGITTGTLGTDARPGSAAATATPADPETARVIGEARGLRSGGQKARALAILTAASEKSPQNKMLLRERGLLSAEMGQLAVARDLLAQSIDDNDPNWQTHSALGSALAAEGRHGEAQKHFARALELGGNPQSVLNNLALSYALDGKKEEAEALLRQAAREGGDAKARQNLALIVGLDGRTDEARAIAETVLPQDAVSANAGYLDTLRKGRVKVSRAKPPEAGSTTVETARASAK